MALLEHREQLDRKVFREHRELLGHLVHREHRGLQEIGDLKDQMVWLETQVQPASQVSRDPKDSKDNRVIKDSLDLLA